MTITYKRNAPLSLSQFTDIYHRSTLGERRPVDKPEVMQGMKDNASLTITAWDGERLAGIARSVTDFTYIAYLSDLAVDIHYQNMGIGRRLIKETRKALGIECTLVLLAAPAAREYYPHIGFEGHDSAWVLSPRMQLN